jgi:hypothetical protein
MKMKTNLIKNTCMFLLVVFMVLGTGTAAAPLPYYEAGTPNCSQDNMFMNMSIFSKNHTVCFYNQLAPYPTRNRNMVRTQLVQAISEIYNLTLSNGSVMPGKNFPALINGNHDEVIAEMTKAFMIDFTRNTVTWDWDPVSMRIITNPVGSKPGSDGCMVHQWVLNSNQSVPST